MVTIVLCLTGVIMVYGVVGYKLLRNYAIRIRNSVQF